MLLHFTNEKFKICSNLTLKASSSRYKNSHLPLHRFWFYIPFSALPSIFFSWAHHLTLFSDHPGCFLVISDELGHNTGAATRLQFLTTKHKKYSGLNIALLSLDHHKMHCIPW
uniref:Uncharacterized protein n=1 Tax=Pyxicephalus adspersus TaxID=30357 RepID=A0AAV3A218_PYXAD|nr:TPA: hypothetical protein GDO54_017446 [Pyxicephalus adspersus]